MVKAKRPVHCEVSGIQAEEYDGDVMKIGEYGQFCATVQMNKAIPVLLEIRDEIKEMKGDVKEMKGDIKAVIANTEAIPQIHEEIREFRYDIQPGIAMQL